MRKRTLLLLTTFAIALPMYAATGRSQSYFTYDDGGTVIRQAEDGREIEARINVPVYPGDEVITNRRGRSEIRLADGNVIALDRSTAIRFKSILDSYEGDSSQTMVELRYGHVAVQRSDSAREMLRLDTENASYAATGNAIYAVDTDSHGGDRVSVFDGEIEVRTPARASRIRAGEEASVDSQGLYGLVSRRSTADEFEHWFIRRAERYDRADTRYLDRSLAYSDYDLEQHGTWNFVAGIGAWGWRPYVSVGWRPYYNGRWMYGPSGCLTWISYEPWGWVPYHYGRWAYDGVYGWVWMPGYTYSPAWVYWMYGPGYFGWAPAGWYDCYRPYYNWAYRPYMRADFGFGFYGRVHVREIDLRPWTFVSPNNIISARVDQAALNTDAIRQRLLRDPSSGMATVTGAPARFNRSEIRDPAAAVSGIARRGLGSGTGREGSGAATDMTPFFRRDPELSNTVRERIVRGVGVVVGGGVGPVSGGSGFTPSGVPGPNTPGTLEGRVPPRSDDSGSGVIERNTGGRREPSTPSAPPSPSTVDRGSGTRRDAPSWRDRIDRIDRSPSTPSVQQPPADRSPALERSRDESWRGRVVGRGGEAPAVDRAPLDRAPRDGTPVERTPVDRGSDIPRRIIDRIGGARIYGDTPRGDTPRESPPRGAGAQREAPPRIERSSPPPPPPRQEHSSPPPSRSSEGEHIKRDH